METEEQVSRKRIKKTASYQLMTERVAIVVLSAILMLAAITTLGAPPRVVFERFQKDFGDWVSPTLFSSLFLFAALLAPLLLQPWARRLHVIYRRSLYTLCAGTLVIYTLPVGWFVLRTGTGGLGALLYVIFFIMFVVIAIATYRE